MTPEGLSYEASWVDSNLDRCFQVMECDDARLLEEWLLTGEISWTLSSCPCAGRRKQRKFSRRSCESGVSRKVLGLTKASDKNAVRGASRESRRNGNSRLSQSGGGAGLGVLQVHECLEQVKPASRHWRMV